MLASSLVLFSVLLTPQATEGMVIQGDKGAGSVRLKVLAGMEHKPVPNAEVPFYHSYSGEATLPNGKISMTVKYVEPDSIKGVYDDFRREMNRVNGAVPAGSRWKKLDHDGYRGELSYVRTIEGNAYLCERGFAPVMYVRFIVLTGDVAAQAEEIFAAATFASPTGSGNVYPSGFPRDWEYSLGRENVKLPWPQKGFTTEKVGPDGTKESITIQVYRHPDGEIYRSEINSGKTYSISEAAKRTYPSPVPINRLYTIAKVDAVKVGGQYLVRSRGTSGGDQFLLEYVTWTGRTTAGSLETMIAYRKPGAKWPRATPFDPEAAGLPVTDDLWPDTVGVRSRPLKDGDQTIWLTSFEPPRVDAKFSDVFHFGTESGVSMAAVLGSSVEKMRAMSVPTDDGTLWGNWPKLDSALAYGYVKYGDVAWSSFLQYNSPGYSNLTDRFYVKQKEREFLVEQTAADAGPDQIKLIQERYASFKGSANRPFLTEGRKNITWIVPAADFRSVLNNVPSIARFEDRRSVGRAGNVSNSIGFEGGSLYVSWIDRGTGSLHSWHTDIVENHEGGNSGKVKSGEATLRGRKVLWYQSDLPTKFRLTTVYWRDSSNNGNKFGAIHIRTPKESKPDSWIEAYEKAGFKFADGK
ncbi:hypothetical protein EON82_10030 [bacterium]|nr:MAG: hypothetical protein EON82_10030 [bacterium]